MQATDRLCWPTTLGIRGVSKTGKMEIELIELKDIKAVPDIIHVYPQRVKSERTPLVIDNGNILYLIKCSNRATF